MRVRFSAAGRPQAVSLSRGLFQTLGGLAFLALAACAPPPGQGNGSANVPPERVMSAGFVDLDEVYINDIDLPALAEKGMLSLASIDSRVTVAREGNALSIGLTGGQTVSYTGPDGHDAAGWGRLTGEAMNDLTRQSASLGSADVETLYEAMFDAMIRSLDPFSRYASREEARENRASRDGFGGIGVRVDTAQDKGVTVLSVMEGTPAERAGLKAEDVIVSVDGESTLTMEQRTVIQRLRGPVGSSVELGILRQGQPLVIRVHRAHIVPQTVTGELHGNIAVIRISGFNHSTAEMVKERVELLAEMLPGGLQGLVLDLRGNPGGLLDQSVAVSDLFLGGGKIVTTHGRHRDSHQYFNADRDQIAPGVPMVVLVDGHSASASEIVAAALQDNGRAIVVGSATYGKGTVQTVLTLPNEGELTLTWARFHAPSGYAMHKRGILPDICTSGSGNEDSVLRKIRRGQLPLPAVLRQSPVDDSDDLAVTRFRDHCPPVKMLSALELDVAVALLRDNQLYAQASGLQSAAVQP